MQRLFPVRVGETVPEQFQLDLELEHAAVERLNRGIALAVLKGDNGTRELLARILVSEEDHIDWLETQQETIRQIGAERYLAQQLHANGGAAELDDVAEGRHRSADDQRAGCGRPERLSGADCHDGAQAPLWLDGIYVPSSGVGGTNASRGHFVEISVTVNGSVHTHDVEPRTLLVHYIREQVGLTGTNIGCDTSSCGACTVHIGGESVKSCTVLAVQADGADITDHRGPRHRRPAAPDAAGLHGEPRPAVRVLHPRHGDGGHQPAQGEPPPRPSARCASASRATSAAAPATTTSSRPSWPPPTRERQHTVTTTAFPGHAGRRQPLTRWRSLARIGGGDPR